ncbi:hypothetical protein CEUSTIGMA_g2335.t1 [Chlamydomonas eustigma]|uniref:Protein kinase domain-containing protein n=1 Tax=Chlamydomonas eustigma TaxID=1157962 RepID=A0A250WW05_9CHLO|nr:hypothetical protein CEUSTIGMA_g2335.t1 [Chlamydomonas eustigma]|eukprot:GAX74889.1 hypothetical protein CEUSTIGMA_g2335.t1 [Chlamydomonas eustigma]
MQICVQKGNIQEATEIGRKCCIPLSVLKPELKTGHKVSEGTESHVYEGVYNGQAVAIKKLKLRTAADLDRFRSELIILSELTDHPSIVRLVGAKALPPDYLIVLSLASSNLRQKLYEEAWRPTWDLILRVSLQVTDAVLALHTQQVVHRDIKPANLLWFNDGERVVLSDFGLSVRVGEVLMEEAEMEALPAANGALKVSNASTGRPSGGFHKKHMVGTLEYMAPEVLMREPTSPASDIYALGVTINELATAVVPFSDCIKDNPEVHTVLEMGYGRQELAAAVCAEGLRPLMPKSCPPGFQQLLLSCWHLHPSARPSVSEVRAQLVTILESLSSWQQNKQPMDVDSPTLRLGGAEAELPCTAFSEAELPCTAFSASTHDMPISPETAMLSHEEASWLQLFAMQGSNQHEREASWLPTVTSGSFEAIGPRDQMEDRNIVNPTWGLTFNPPHHNIHLFAVFDGHRGSDAAEYCRTQLPEALARVSLSSPSIGVALKRAFKEMEEGYKIVWQSQCERMKREGKRSCDVYPGCTALVALIVGNQLFIANAGDCRAVLCRAGTTIAVTRDHTASLPDEKARVESLGGTLVWSYNDWRVGGCGLQVTRSIGDFDVKGPGGGLTAEPEIANLALGSEDWVLVLASDGLWEVCGNEEVVGLIRDTVKDPLLCAKRLVIEALARGCRDNVTAVVSFLQPVSTVEKIFGDGKEAFSATATSYSSRRSKGMVVQERFWASDEMKETY